MCRFDSLVFKMLSFLFFFFVILPLIAVTFGYFSKTISYFRKKDLKKEKDI